MGAHEKQNPCGMCSGKGKIEVDADGQEGKPRKQEVTCPQCDGSGKQ